MPQASPNYNLHVRHPHLVKEWHPTKNMGIKPSQVTPGSGKKVWWICNEGHEWQAVVYSRTRGSGCPFCNSSKSANDTGMTVSNSVFKTEWHPSANVNLNPAAWRIGDHDKVWWICNRGHEWQATFKERVKGKDCPACDRRQVKQIPSRNIVGSEVASAATRSDSMPEIEPLESIFGEDFRKIKRYKVKATVTIEVPSTQHLFYAEMKNFSHEGLCLETSTSLTPGTKVNIRLDRPLFEASQESYVSIIKWCRGLTDEEGSVYNFGLGVKFL